MYLMVIPAILYFLIFAYVPMYGVVIAFKDYNIFKGIGASPWAGLKHFERFFESIYFWRVIRNTVMINVWSLICGFPAPIILALLLNEVTRPLFKRTIQNVTYLPHFISMVVIAGMVLNILGPRGPVNYILNMVGLQTIAFMHEPSWFRPVYVISGIWQGVGYGSIIYLAAMSGIDPTLYDAAEVDGAGRWGRMRHITLPGIMPTMMVILLLNLGSMLSVGFEKVYLLYSPEIYETADVIATYVYRAGLLAGANEYDFGTAVGLFNSVTSMILLAAFNWLAGRFQQQQLW
jgi:putative aldouronate transport system permease protein